MSDAALQEALHMTLATVFQVASPLRAAHDIVYASYWKDLFESIKMTDSECQRIKNEVSHLEQTNWVMAGRMLEQSTECSFPSLLFRARVTFCAFFIPPTRKMRTVARTSRIPRTTGKPAKCLWPTSIGKLPSGSCKYISRQDSSLSRCRQKEKNDCPASIPITVVY